MHRSWLGGSTTLIVALALAGVTGCEASKPNTPPPPTNNQGAPADPQKAAPPADAPPSAPDAGTSQTTTPPARSECGPLDPKQLASASLFQLRNWAKLQCDRDDGQGELNAAATLEEAVRRAPDDFLDRLNLSRALLLSDMRAGEAGPHIEKARALLGERDATALEYVTGLHAQLAGKHDAAEQAFARVVELAPELVQGWVQLGRAREELAKWPEAADCYRRALAIRADYRPAAYRLLQCLVQLEQTGTPEFAEIEKKFHALPEKGHADPVKCALTNIERVDAARSEVQPAAAKLSFADATATFLPGEAAAQAACGAHDVVLVRGTRPGVCDLVLIGDQGARVFRFDAGKGVFASSAIAGGEATVLGATAGAAGDLDNDGDDDVIVCAAGGLALLDGGPDGTFTLRRPFDAPLEQAGAGPSAAVRRAEPFDADHDGDLDVVAVVGGGVRVLRNNGDATYTQLAPFPDVAISAKARTRFDAHDFDQANDIDFVFPSPDGSAALIALNLRDGAFRSEEVALDAKTTGVLAEDLNGDGAPDIFAWGAESKWYCALNEHADASPGEAHLAWAASGTTGDFAPIHDARLADLDNDGDLDVLLATGKGARCLLNDCGISFDEVRVPVAAGAECRTALAADLDGDGRLEILMVGADGALRIASVQAAPAYAGFHLRPTGGRDNKSGIGTVVECFGERRYQSVMLKGALGAHIGVGAESLAGLDGVRLRWPAGIIQPLLVTDLEIGAGREARFAQHDGPMVSCPFLFARGAEGWRFLTDIVGIAPLDEWLPPGAEPHLDPEEYVRIAGERLEAIDGAIEIAITEELKETTYLDRVELFAIEHSVDVDLYIDESTRQEKYGPLRVLAVERAKLFAPAEVRAREAEIDATALVAARDGRFLHAYPEAPSQWRGWVERHEIEFVAPRPARALLLTGRVDWYTSSVRYALAQHGRTWGATALSCDEGGAARGVLLAEDLGVCAGIDRTMVAEFEARPAGTRYTLSAQHRFLWDELRFAEEFEATTFEVDAAVDGGVPRGALRLARVELITAELGYHGFSRMVGDRARHEMSFDYERAGPEDAFARPRGFATRYGDVRSLLTAHDDKLVVLVASDEVRLRFTAPPAPGAGRARTWFLRVNGWAKESNFHGQAGRTIEPLPYRGMNQFPPAPGATPTTGDADYLDYLRTWQTRPIER